MLRAHQENDFLGKQALRPGFPGVQGALDTWEQLPPLGLSIPGAHPEQPDERAVCKGGQSRISPPAAFVDAVC